MDMYERINKDQESEDEETDEDEEMRIVQEKLSVTMESASHHCDVIKNVLRKMLSEIAMVSATEKSLCMAVSDSIGGSIDRIQFALDNLYDQGVDEHERASECKKELKEKEKELSRLREKMNQNLENLFEDHSSFVSEEKRNELAGLLDEFGFRNTGDEIIHLQNENETLIEKLENTQLETQKAMQESKIKKSQLNKALQEFKELRETFEECQGELANSKNRIADLESYQDAYNEEYYQEEIEKLKNLLGYAHETKIRTVLHLDQEIKRLRDLLDPKWTVQIASQVVSWSCKLFVLLRFKL